MRSRRCLSLLLLVSISVVADAQTPPSKERGFKPELVYEFRDFDNVTLFNGNLTATIPLGPSYPVGAGLSYSFVLRYSGNLWRNADDCRYVRHPNDDDDGCYNIMLGQPENGGFGWHLSFGDLREPEANSIPGTAPSMWAYVSPDGSEHLFYYTLHRTCTDTVTTNCETYTPDVWYSRDGTYLRIKELGSYVVVEFPNGERHRFDEYANDDWRLTYMYNAFSSVDANGKPTSNYISIEYVASSVADVDDTWVIKDSHSREHKIKFREGPLVAEAHDLVDTVEIEAFRSGSASRVAATYSFNYEILDGSSGYLAKPCAGTTTATTAAAFLSALTLPSGESWSFTYDKPAATATCTEKETSATMLSATLPTGGKIRWTYQAYRYAETIPAAIGVATRTAESDGTDVERTTYTTSLGVTTVARNVKYGSEWRPDSKTVQRHVYTNGTEFGLPYDVFDAADGGGRRLSAETYDCNPASNTCTKVREKHVKYEWDYIVLTAAECPADYPCEQNRNRRPLSERTVFVDDANREATVGFSNFDGLGHYRLTTTGGTFPSGNVRTSYTGYNSQVGTYALDTNGVQLPGFTMLSASAPWILGTYEAAYASEGSQTARVQTCFDTDTGFLKRKRTMRGNTADSSDLLVVFTEDDAGGFVKTEEYFGGGKNTIPTSDLCELTPTHDDLYTYRLDHTYEFGSLKTSRYADRYGTPLSFFNAEYVIDKGTGLIRQSEDTAGKITTFDFDKSARLLTVKPPDLLTTTYTYTNATSSANAKVAVETGTGASRVAAEFEYDALGGLWREKKLMPGEEWSIRETLYDALGRRASVSEPGFGAPATAKTTFADYDAFGRPGKITAPDGGETTYSYTGNRLTTRTQKVATSETGEDPVSVTEELDRAGRLVSVTESSGTTSAVKTSYAYDVGNRLKQVSINGTQNRDFEYDGRGLLLSEEHPESATTTYEYDARGKVVTRTTSLPATLTFEYDRAERLRFVKENGVVWKEFIYDSAPGSGLGKIASTIRHNRNTVLGSDVTVGENYFYYGRGGRLSSKDTVVSTGETFTDTYTYDAFGQLTDLMYPTCPTCSPAPPARTATNRYANGFLSEVFGYTSATSPIAYHANGMVSAIRHLNANGTAGPLYEQTLDNGMARPGSITVTNFCDDFAITTQPPDAEVTSGSPAGISVSAPGATSYEWFQGNSQTPISGETGATLQTTVTQTTTFWVRAGNGICTIDSRKATVTVSACAAPDATVTAPATMLASDTKTASVSQTSGATYNWSIVGGTITGGSGTSAITFRAGCSGSVTLNVTVTASCGSSASASRSVSITPLSVVMSDPAPIGQGSSTTLTAVISGIAPWTVSWSDGSTQTNVTSSTVSRSVSPSGTTTYTVTATDAYGCSATDSALVTVTPPAPFALNATASTTTRVELSWQFTGSADEFRVYRNGSFLATTTSQSHSDLGVVASTAYVYEVRAVKSGTSSTGNPRDLATTVMLDAITPYVTRVAAGHLSQLRTAVNAVRRLAGIGDYTFSAGVGSGLPVAAAHILELRGALDPARTGLALPAVGYTTAVGSGAMIRAADVTDLQGGVK